MQMEYTLICERYMFHFRKTVFCGAKDRLLEVKSLSFATRKIYVSHVGEGYGGASAARDARRAALNKDK